MPQSNEYDPYIQQEMDVIISVLNKLFNEKNNELYIGDKTIFPIHNKTNNILNNINKHSKLISRKNKGVKIFPNNINNPEFIFNNNPFSKSSKRYTRKIHK